MEDCNRILDCRFGSHTLDGLDNDFLRFLVGCHLCLFHDFIDVGSSFWLGFVFQGFDQTLLRLFGRKPGQSFQMFDFTLVKFLQILLLLIYQFQLGRQILLHGIHFAILALQVFLTLVQIQLTLFQLSLYRLYLWITGGHLFLQVRFQMKELLFYFEQLLLLHYFRLLFSLAYHSVIPWLHKDSHHKPHEQASDNEGHKCYDYSHTHFTYSLNSVILLYKKSTALHGYTHAK